MLPYPEETPSTNPEPVESSSSHFSIIGVQSTTGFRTGLFIFWKYVMVVNLCFRVRLTYTNPSNVHLEWNQNVIVSCPKDLYSCAGQWTRKSLRHHYRHVLLQVTVLVWTPPLDFLFCFPLHLESNVIRFPERLEKLAELGMENFFCMGIVT